MNETKSVKSLKKQLAAAIAMVTVAAVALGSSTYAWFVSNNKVTAQTTQIKAQSNTAFMSIEYKKSAIGSQTTQTTEWYNNGADTVALFPAEVQENGTAPKFVTAYGTATDNGAKSGEYIDVGTATEAVTAHYAVGEENNYSISSAGVNLSKLVVDKVEVTTGNDKDLASAVRVLVVGEDNWQVWKAGETDGLVKEKTKDTPLAATVTKDADTKVSVYVYYDGNDTNIKTDNLEALESPVSVTIHFSASQPTTATE